jgi:hypothetical protein
MPTPTGITLRDRQILVYLLSSDIVVTVDNRFFGEVVAIGDNVTLYAVGELIYFEGGDNFTLDNYTYYVTSEEDVKFIYSPP